MGKSFKAISTQTKERNNMKETQKKAVSKKPAKATAPKKPWVPESFSSPLGAPKYKVGDKVWCLVSIGLSDKYEFNAYRCVMSEIVCVNFIMDEKKNIYDTEYYINDADKGLFCLDPKYMASTLEGLKKIVTAESKRLK